MARGEFNPARGDVQFDLEGEELILRYTLRSLALLQDRIGVQRFDKLLQGDPAAFQDFDMIGQLLEVGLLYHQPTIADRDVLEELGMQDLERVAGAIGQAFSAAFPAAQEGGRAGPPRPAAAPAKKRASPA